MAAFSVYDEDEVRHRLEEGAQLGLGGPQRFLVLPALCNVADDRADHLPPVERDHADPYLHVEQTAVFAPVLPLADDAALAPHRPLYGRVHVPARMGDEVVDLHLADLPRRVAEHPLKGRVRLHEAAGVGVEQIDAVGGLLYDGPVALLAPPEPLLCLPPPDGRAQSARGGPEGPDLRRRPRALFHALVETYEPPPASFDENGHEGYGQDLLCPELGLLALREIPHVTVHKVPPPQHPYPAAEAGGLVGDALQQGVIYLRRDARRRPLVAHAGPQLAVVAHVVLENVDAAGLRSLPEPSEDGPYTLLPAGRLPEELVGREAHGLEDGVAPLELLLDPPTLPPLLRFLQPPLHCLGETPEVALHHVVVGSAAHRLDRDVLPYPSGHNDERRIRAGIVGHLQGLQRRKARHLVVRDDHPPRQPERFFHLFGGVHPLMVYFVPGASKPAQKQQGVVLGVLHEQHAQRLPEGLAFRCRYHGSSFSSSMLTRPVLTA